MLIFTYRGKMKLNLLAYHLSKETITTIIMLYKNAKAMVRSPDGDINFFNIVAGVLLRDTLSAHTFIFYLEYIQWESIDLIKETVSH